MNFLICQDIIISLLRNNKKHMMKSINIDKIISEYLFVKNSDIDKIKVTNDVIEYCKNLELDLDENKLLTLLQTIDNYYKSIGLMKIVSDENVYNQCDIIVEKYITNLFANKKIYKKIKEIKNANPTNLLEMIYKNFYEGKNENVNNIFFEIKKLKNKIIFGLEENVIVNSEQSSNNKITELPSNFVITKDIYNTFQKKIENKNVRKSVEDVYNTKSKKVLDNFAILILYRHKYANLLGHQSYFEYVKQKGSVESIKNLINDLLIKIENKSRQETKKIQKELKYGTNKISQSDVNFYCEKIKPDTLFKPVDIIKILFETSEKYFGITFKPAKYNLKLWSEKIMTCKVLGIAKEELGYVHFDFFKTKTKKNIAPLCIKLSGNPKRICLITSYDDINTSCMTYNDIVLLFREFGCILQMITHHKDELIVKNDEFDILMSQVMEHIVWDKSIIEKICANTNDQSLVTKFQTLRQANFANTIKAKCVMSLFDHIIHNSEDLISLIKQNHFQNIQSGEIIETLYKKIYADIWNAQSDIFDSQINNINPDIIFSEISGKEGTLYSNILTDILSFSIYVLIKEGNGKDFVKYVLSQKTHDLRPALNQFIAKLNVDSYQIYLEKVIKCNSDASTEFATHTNTNIKMNSKSDLNITHKNKNNFKNANMILTDTSANYFDDGENYSNNNLSKLKKISNINKLNKLNMQNQQDNDFDSDEIIIINK